MAARAFSVPRKPRYAFRRGSSKDIDDPRNAMTAIPHDLPQRILDGSPDAILVSDPAGTVRYWNAAAERVFGFSASDALGASMDFIIPERLRGRHWAGWEAVMRSGVTRYGRGQLLAVPALHKDGRQLSIEFS